MSKFKRGDVVYFIRSGNEVIPAQVMACQGVYYTLRFYGHDKTACSGIRLEERRIYASREAAGQGLKPTVRPHRDTHWDWKYR